MGNDLKKIYADFLEEKTRRQRRRKFYTYFPDAGPLRRELYPKHIEFFRAGAKYRERGFMAANRIGKTESAGGFELTCHLTGLYPEWWEGRRFDHPIDAWAAGKSNETTRNIIQFKLFGKVLGSGLTKRLAGTGVIPGDLVGKPSWRSGFQDLVDTVPIKHASGEWSQLALKSYEQGRGSFEGTEKHVIWLDEEPPEDVYGECLIRTMTTGGMIIATFTPLEGITPVVLSFLPNGKLPDGNAQVTPTKYLVTAGWDHVPHLTEDAKRELLAATPPYLRDARSKGIPQLGSGAIYPIAEEEITCDPFEIPFWWPRAYGMDVGWNCTAAVWGAWDRESDCVYLYSEYKKGEAEPVVHAHAINARGKWIPGVIDPASRGRGQGDGKRLLTQYQDYLNIDLADNAVEAGLFACWDRFSTGRLKIFKSLVQTLGEIRMYRRDEHGKVVKDNDHVMDAMRYLVMSGMRLAKTEPVDREEEDAKYADDGRSAVGGY